MVENKTYAAVRKVDLNGVSEGWDESCYAYVIPSTYEDQRKIAEMQVAEMSDGERIEYQLQFVKDHFISGKIRVFDGEAFVAADMRPDDTAASVDVTDVLYAEIMGLGLDPKEIRKAASRKALQATDTTTIGSQLSEENNSPTQ